MRYLRWVGLMSSLLFVGVLGGLMAPLPSEAVPTITVKIDGVQVAPVAANGSIAAVPSILNTASSTCTLAEGTLAGALGYTACYAIRTSNTRVYTGSNGRQWKIQVVPGLTARLRIADQVGQDKLSLVGIQFVPVPWTGATHDQNTNEEHIIEVIVRNGFTSSVNVANAASIATDGGYIWAMRTGGEFTAGPAGSNCNLVQGDNLCDAIGDKVEFTGTGLFSGATRQDILSPSGSAQNALPLSFTVAGPHADPILSFAGVTNADMAQVDPTYPRFNCAKAGALTTCQPDIIQTLKITLKGPDAFVLVGGGDGDGSRCTITPAEQTTLNKNIRTLTIIVGILDRWEAAHHNAALRGFITYLQFILHAATLPPSDSNCPGAVFVQIAQAVQQANDQLAFIQLGAKPAVGVSATGTITITKYTSEETQAKFHFTITGPSASDSLIDMSGNNAKSIVVTVNAGPNYSVSEVPLGGWTQDVGDGAPYCNDGGPTSNLVVPSGGNVNCYFSNTKNPVVTYGSIHIIKRTNPPTFDQTFVFTGTGNGMGDFEIRTDVDQCNDACWGGQWSFDGLTAGATGGIRVIKETGFPVIDGVDNYWYLANVICEKAVGDSDTTWSNVYDEVEGPLRGVKVENLAANDALYCTFYNQIAYP